MLDELEALSEIYDKNIFSYNLIKESGDINAEFIALNKLIDEDFITLLGNRNEYTITYLPPIYFKFKVNINLEICDPTISLNSIWLPKRCLRMLEDKLIEIIHDNDESKLWLCCEFLENEASKLFSDKDSTLILNLNDLFPLDGDDKIAEILKLLLDYNDNRDDSLFRNLIIECEVCLVMKRGNECSKFNTCEHVVCNVCLTDHFNTRISIGCLNLSCAVCGKELDYEEVRRVMDSQSFERWDNLSFDNCVKSLEDHSVCTRCQTFIAVNPDDGYGFCRNCRFTFCLDCKQTFNGPTCCHNLTVEAPYLALERERNRLAGLKPNIMTYKEQKELDDEIWDESSVKKARDRSKNKIQDALALKLIGKNFKNVKACPNCAIMYEKNGGCNHMTCPFCKNHFCYKCNKTIDSSNPYGHFTKKCKLFDIS